MFWPPELYRPIIQNIDTRADLYKLLFVSRIVSNEAERALYREINLVRYDMALSMRLFLHLIYCQRVARYVQGLRILGVINTAGLLPNQYWYSVNQALRATSQLRVLHLSTWSNADPKMTHLPSYIFANCSFKLEVLKLDNYVSGELPPIDLTHVKELSLWHEATGRRPLTSHPDAFLSLQVLTSSLPQFLNLGTRNTDRIKALELSGGFDDMNDEMGAFPSVTSLKIYSTPSNIVGQAFPSLRYLCCYDVFMNLAEITTSTMPESLALAKNLEQLWLVFYWPSAEYPPDLHTRFFAAISSLHEFVLSCDLVNGQLWNRNSSEPTPIQVDDFMGQWKDSR